MIVQPNGQEHELRYELMSVLKAGLMWPIELNDSRVGESKPILKESSEARRFSLYGSVPVRASGEAQRPPLEESDWASQS